MFKKIEDLYSDQKFELIMYYFKEHNILFADSLSAFDFSELLFVPGIPHDVLEDAKDVYHTYISASKEASAQTSACINTVSFQNEQIYTAEYDMPQEQEYSNVQLPYVPDALISKIYLGVPRSLAFIRYCQLNGKTMMSQISADDFKHALSVKGLGSSSVKALEELYSNFYINPALPAPANAISKDETLTDIALDIEIEFFFGTLPRGEAFIRHCHNLGITNISQLQNFNFNHTTVKGIGASSMEKLHAVYLDTLKNLSNSTSQDFNCLNDIPQENRKLELCFLRYYNVSPASIQILNAQGYQHIEDIMQNGISPYYYSLISNALSKLTFPISKSFVRLVDQLKETPRICIIRKSQGDTLQKIADAIGVTRERIRQITSKTAESLKPTADMIANILLSPDKSSFSFQDILSLFSDPLYAKCCKFVLMESDEVIHLKFSDKFIRKTHLPDNFDTALQQFAHDAIGDGINFYDNLENIESSMSEYGFHALDFEDIMNYLVKAGYHFYGDYVAKGNQSYAFACRDAIIKFFPNGIKLDSNESNEDMKNLRAIMSRHYHGLALPDNNRALTSRITTQLILSGRGKYCAIESVVYDISLFSEVYQFIQDSPQSSMYYSEIFSQFQGRFLAETNISNSHFFHGMLKYLYPQEFTYERDMLVKNGAPRQVIDDRICRLIIDHKGPISKSEIKSAVPGLNDFVISFVTAREPKLIPWEYNVFNHIDNISVTDADIHTLEAILQKESAKHKGYLSDSLLYRAVQQYFPIFIEKNSLKNPQNLFYIVAYYLRGSYHFHRPHIISPEFPVEDPSVVKIAKFLLHGDSGINYLEYVKLAETLSWAEGTRYNVFSDIEKDCIRISENDYLFSSCFHLDDRTLLQFKHQISALIYNTGYFAVNSLFNFDVFPPCSYEWNGFLIESIIREFDIGFKIIAPQVRDRRYQRGIIVSNTCMIDTFEDLAADLIKKDGITALTESELEKYLKNKGLIIKNIPQELYECPSLPFKNEVFTLI